jgi:hypothetical protein
MAGGPNMTGIGWLDWIIAAGAVIGAVGVIWRKVLRPMTRGAVLLEQVLPVLVDIGHEFKPNSGETLKDSLNRIEENLATLHTYAHETRHLQAGQIAGLAKFDEGITRKLDDLSEHMGPVPAKLDEIANAAGVADAAAVEHRESHPESPGE